MRSLKTVHIALEDTMGKSFNISYDKLTLTSNKYLIDRDELIIDWQYIINYPTT
ncbi:MAG: hypothetical protein AAGA80_01630 [Cyanobacteria bacterium P01_F01_bin.143]